MSVDTLCRWERAGKLKTKRDRATGGSWLVARPRGWRSAPGATAPATSSRHAIDSRDASCQSRSTA